MTFNNVQNFLEPRSKKTQNVIVFDPGTSFTIQIQSQINNPHSIVLHQGGFWKIIL